MHEHKHDSFRFSSILRLLHPLSDAQVRQVLGGAPEAAQEFARQRACLPRARLALAVQHQADQHLCNDAIALHELRL